ncbi:MAG TPA: UbiA family prenyltransferase [Candidatus Limnocylindrales bacterium]
MGLVRIVHPFPSALDAAAVVAIALIAGAGTSTALRLGLGMLFLQFAIGIANDLADAPTDAIGKPDKPLPAGLLSSRQAGMALLVAGTAGLASAASVGVPALMVGLLGLADGLLYDLRLKGTALSWAPFAAGVGLLPVYGWWGVTGSWPGALWGVAGMAVLVGVTLALANALADLEKDRRSGVRSIATTLGRDRTLALDAALMLAIQIIVLATAVILGAGIWALALGSAGACLAWLGVGLASAARERARQAGWEVQAIGFVLLGAGWLSALSSAGALGR